MALKILQVVAASAVVLIVILIIPVIIRLRRTLEEAGRIIAENSSPATTILKRAQAAMDSVNSGLEKISEISDDSEILISRVGKASGAMDKALKSPLTRIGLMATGTAATSIVVKKRAYKNLKESK
ncbi:MAG: hypothetical protein PHP64_05565 [Actinomycetota bacterium]|nr:hypothetical protein [Actinomycetota bacterium]